MMYLKREEREAPSAKENKNNVTKLLSRGPFEIYKHTQTQTLNLRKLPNAFSFYYFEIIRCVCVYAIESLNLNPKTETKQQQISKGTYKKSN